MASIVWTSIFVFLVAELIVTVLLVVPIPLKVRAWFARFVPAEALSNFANDNLKKPILFIGIGLALALAESIFVHKHILERIEDERRGVRSWSSHRYDYFYPGLHDKERKYKSERNMYLSAFALTLLFVIGRIASLLRESVELHQEAERLEKAIPSSSKGGTKKKN
mmetsp:Transcript_8056/g.16729  ORF Transcript_8056/g.16729 Transcript_8056/m.16729 type:complete len:166 (-) Transcript_8056:1659-2156(-)